MNNKIKLVFFDFDGTLITTPANSTWELIDNKLGCEFEEDLLKKDFDNGKIDFQTWSKKSTEIYKKYGLTEERLIDIVKKYVKPISGTKEVFNKLKEKGIQTAIISGSIFNIYEIFSRLYDISVDYPNFASRFYFNTKGELIDGKFTNYDYEGKIPVFKNICYKLSIDYKETMMVGNDRNDIAVFNESGISIAFNPKKDIVAKSAQYVINESNLKSILNYIF